MPEHEETDLSGDFLVVRNAQTRADRLARMRSRHAARLGVSPLPDPVTDQPSPTTQPKPSTGSLGEPLNQGEAGADFDSAGVKIGQKAFDIGIAAVEQTPGPCLDVVLGQDMVRDGGAEAEKARLGRHWLIPSAVSELAG